MSWAEIKAYLKHLFFGEVELDEEPSFPELWKQFKKPSFLLRLCLVLSLISLFVFKNTTFFIGFIILTLLFWLWNDILSGDWRKKDRCELCWQQMKRERSNNWNKQWVVDAYKKSIEEGSQKSRARIMYERIHNERCVEKIKEGGMNERK